MELTERRVLLLGANGVLGSSIAGLLTARGARVIGTARAAETAGRLAPDLAERLLLDLEDDASITALTDYLNSTGIDAVVNATGLVGFGAPADTPAPAAARLMRVNHLGPADVITRLLPALRASAAAGRTPVIVGITGVVAERAFPGMAAYVASKAAHSAWLAAIRLDLRRERIRVLDAQPGHTETGLATRAIIGVAPRFPTGLAPEQVATTIVEAMVGDITELPSSAFPN